MKKNYLTQRQRVLNKLRRDGKITRNQCLSVFPAISRLGAIICSLQKEGWKFHTRNDKGDYVYEVVESPIKPKPSIIMVDGIPKAVYN